MWAGGSMSSGLRRHALVSKPPSVSSAKVTEVNEFLTLLHGIEGFKFGSFLGSDAKSRALTLSVVAFATARPLTLFVGWGVVLLPVREGHELF